MTVPLVIPSLTRQRVRSIDQRAIAEFGMNGLVLMENAGRGAAEVIDRLAPLGKRVILCGLGNNGGDGYVIARHLDLMSPDSVEVWVVADGSEAEWVGRMAPDARSNYEILRKSNVLIHGFCAESESLFHRSLASAGVIVDALVGTGSTGALRSPMHRVVMAANATSALRIAIDIPSGLDCDSGKASQPCFQAAHTVTFVAPKVGFTLDEAPKFVGQVTVVDIGVPRALLQSMIN